MPYSDAWLKAIAEYNGYGLAQHDAKYQIDRQLAGQMLGFKVRVAQTLTFLGKLCYFNGDMLYYFVVP